jgi:hemimethylated DNA binding protein
VEADVTEYPKYRVGTVFRHKRYNYCGAIFGWTNTCKPPDGEECISQMRVDKLPKGRNQPFYHVLYVFLPFLLLLIFLINSGG